MDRYTTAWESPSNIALIKYWGKKPGIQLPANASVSFTLSQCVSRTSLEYVPASDLHIDVYLDGKPAPDFRPKIEQFFKRVSDQLPQVMHGHYIIRTSNTFPHSSGIASSASGMSALALCIGDLAVGKGWMKDEGRDQLVSNWARLGSGSACRSVYSPLAIWGEHYELANSSDQYAIPYNDIHPIFNDFCDTILLVHQGQKTVSSTVGHDLVNDHPFAAARFDQANKNLSRLLEVMRKGELDEFIEIVESEALTLHSLMMSSRPYFILMKPNTLRIIELIWEKRKTDGVKWCFTLDAGANVHFLYPKADEPKALEFVDKTLSPYCDNGAYICDHVGRGPKSINS